MQPSVTYHRRFIHVHVLLNNQLWIEPLWLIFAFEYDVSSAILDMDMVSSFTCLFDGFISSDFRIVVILILLDSDT